MPRRKGWKCGDDVRANMSAGALKRPSKLCHLYGFTQEFVEQQKAAALIWCSNCKRWAEGKRYRCRECTKRINDETYAKEHPDSRKLRRRAIREEHPERSQAMDRKQSLRRKNVSIEDYERMLAEQGGCCAICGIERTERRLAVDHDHRCCPDRKTCGHCVRGVLCHRCNLSLERLEADPEWAIKALAYLARYPLNVAGSLQHV